MPLETWIGFLLFWMAFEFLPGPNTAFALGTALASPLPRAMMTPIGIAAAAFLHALVASLGLSAIMFASAELFSTVKWLGVAYLVWLGLRRWRGKPGLEMKQGWSRRGAPALVPERLWSP